MLRSLAAVLVGFLFMSATVMVGTIVAGSLFVPGLLVRACGAVMGGWLTARIAVRAPLAHAAVLAAVVTTVTVSASSVSTAPVWYRVAIAAIAVGGVLLGGWLRSAASAATRA